MKIITIDGKEWKIKIKQSNESVSTDFGVGVFNYPDFVGSKLAHKSTTSDKFSLNFSIHKTSLIAFRKSLKKIVDVDNIINHKLYEKLDRIIIEHPYFGAIRGNIIGELACNISSGADIMCSCIFQEHTLDEPITKKNIQDENTDAVNAIDAETTDNFNVDLSVKDKSLISKFADTLNGFYTNIQNSAVVSAFNDFNSVMNAATLDSMRVMNAIKKILALPNEIMPDFRAKLDLLKKQAEAIKNIPVNSANMANFNINVISYNMGLTSKTAFVSEAAKQAASGIKIVPLQ